MNKHKYIAKWYELSNGYWLNIRYLISGFSNKEKIIWLMDIVVGKTKRICNDHYIKAKNSPKKLKDKSTNHNMKGTEALNIALKDLIQFEGMLRVGSEIQIEGSDEQRTNVYRRLTRYGYTELGHYSPGKKWHKRPFYTKTI